MNVDKKDLVDALNVSVKELQQSIDLHCCLVSSLLEIPVDDLNLQSTLDRCPNLSVERVLKKIIQETIDELEASRKSFKSKRLEALRKKLTRVLAEAG